MLCFVVFSSTETLPLAVDPVDLLLNHASGSHPMLVKPGEQAVPASWKRRWTWEQILCVVI